MLDAPAGDLARKKNFAIRTERVIVKTAPDRVRVQ
jgi:hypothetical protein